MRKHSADVMNCRGAGALPALRSGGCFSLWLRNSHLQCQESTPSLRDPPEWPLHQGSYLGGELDKNEGDPALNKCLVPHGTRTWCPHIPPGPGSALLLCPTPHTLHCPSNQRASAFPPQINDYSAMKRTSTSDVSILSFSFNKSMYWTTSNLAKAAI